MSVDLAWLEAEVRVLKREQAGLRRLAIAQQSQIELLQKDSHVPYDFEPLVARLESLERRNEEEDTHRREQAELS